MSNLVQPPPSLKNNDNIEKPLNVTTENFPPFIQVKFITSTYPNQVGNDVYEIPSRLARYGLSELVNSILNKKFTDRKKIQPFEFLINYEEKKKVFLRTTLKDFFITLQKWPENLTTLEYLVAQPPPKNTDTIPHNDWVSVIRHVLYPTSDNSMNDEILVSGCYDGVVRFWNPSDLKMICQYRYFSSLSDFDVIQLPKVIGNSRNHNLMLPSNSEKYKKDLLLLCCGKTEFAHVITYHPPEESIIEDEASKLSQPQIIRQRVLTGHAEKVNCVKIQTVGERVAYITGSNDRTIKFYFSDGKVESVNDETSSSSTEEPPKKKRKLETQLPSLSLKGHKLAVTALEFDDSCSTLLSGSNDHTVKLWDLSKQKIKQTLLGSKVVTSMSFCKENQTLLTSHPDYVIRMWDVRTPSPPRIFRSHKGWVRSVHWSQKSGNSTNFRFVSGGDDNQMKIWDSRSALPVSSISHHVQKVRDDMEEKEEEEEEEEVWTLAKKRNPFERNRHKVLAVRFACGSDSVFFSGSTDCTLKRNVMKI